MKKRLEQQVYRLSDGRLVMWEQVTAWHEDHKAWLEDGEGYDPNPTQAELEKLVAQHPAQPEDMDCTYPDGVLAGLRVCEEWDTTPLVVRGAGSLQPVGLNPSSGKTLWMNTGNLRESPKKRNRQHTFATIALLNSLGGKRAP